MEPERIALNQRGRDRPFVAVGERGDGAVIPGAVVAGSSVVTYSFRDSLPCRGDNLALGISMTRIAPPPRMEVRICRPIYPYRQRPSSPARDHCAMATGTIGRLM
jgi:hypothetical protein